MRNGKKSKGNYGKVKAAPQSNKSSSKMPKPSKNHDVKSKKKKAFSSIKQRMQIITRSQGQSSRVHSHKGFETGYSVAKAKKAKKEKKKKKKKKGTRRAFEMSIPKSNSDFLNRIDVPWYNSADARARIIANDKFRSNDADSDDNDNQEAKQNVMARLQLPSESILSSIDSEITLFSNYIKLGPIEKRAREAFVDEITGIALDQFGKGGRNRNSGATESEEDEIRVVPFGSFATQPVCTFTSDVDMCLWGVVKGEKQPEHITFVDDEDKTIQRNIADVLGQGQQNRDDCPLLTESSLLRTMEAIQNSSQEGSKEAEQKEEDSASPSEMKEEAQSVPDNNDLFFIDRVGENIDKSEEQDNSNAPCDDAVQSATSKPVAKAGFQFEIDVEGVKELGGDVEDLNDCAEVTTNEKDDETKKASTEKGVNPPALGKTDHSSDVVCENKNVPTHESTGQTEVKETATEAVENNNNNDDESKSDVIVIDSDEEDDADKMASFYTRQSSNSASNNVTSTSASASPINLLDSDDSSCDSGPIEVVDSDDSGGGFGNNEVIELSLTSNQPSPQQQLPTKPVIGPTGKTRNEVLNVLNRLTKQLRRSSFTHTIQCRSRARVPIINCSTRTGFEGDIAIGGHNGVDTSMYAMSQVNRFKSFAPIILLMKTLMNQQDLDKPFTGGLGSYKLYVLVAYHIEKHLANGGNDRPSEILISLLLRYGKLGSRRSFPLELTTDLVSLSNRDEAITCDEGICELTPVFRLPDCVEMFRECHERLSDRCLHDGAQQCSYLSSIIDCQTLRQARESSKRRARLCDNIITRPIPQNHPGKVSAGRRISHVFTRNGSTASEASLSNKRKNKNESQGYKRSKSDRTQRGPRGGLIPKNRPDISARKSLGEEAAVLQRGMKQRKNKKKQARDKELTRFASRNSF